MFSWIRAQVTSDKKLAKWLVWKVTTKADVLRIVFDRGFLAHCYHSIMCNGQNHFAGVPNRVENGVDRFLHVNKRATSRPTILHSTPLKSIHLHPRWLVHGSASTSCNNGQRCSQMVSVCVRPSVASAGEGRRISNRAAAALSGGWDTGAKALHDVCGQDGRSATDGSQRAAALPARHGAQDQPGEDRGEDFPKTLLPFPSNNECTHCNPELGIQPIKSAWKCI